MAGLSTAVAPMTPEERQMFIMNAMKGGGYASDPNRGGVTPSGGGYINLDDWAKLGLGLAGLAAPMPFGAAIGLARAGIRANNVTTLDKELQNAGYGKGLGLGQIAGGVLGLNGYGGGDPRLDPSLMGIGGLAEAAYGAGIRNGINDPAMGVSTNQRKREYEPAKSRGPGGGRGAERDRNNGLGDPDRGVSRDIDRGFDSGGYGI